METADERFRRASGLTQVAHRVELGLWALGIDPAWGPPDVAQMRDDLFDMRTILVVLRECEGVQTWYDGTSMISEIDAVLSRTDYR